MMGRSHVTSGALAFLAPASALGLPAGTVILGTAVAAGAAVWPDIDHPGSGISRTFGPITQTFATVVGKLSGGHRNGTHSYAGAGVITELTTVGATLAARSWVAMLLGSLLSLALFAAGWLTGTTDSGKGRGKPAYKRRWHGRLSAFTGTAMALGIVALCVLYGQLAGRILIGLILILVFAAAIRVLRIKGYWDDLAPIPITLAILGLHVDLTVVPYAVALGVFVHICGDQVTYGGCPTGWPWSQTMRGLHWFKTNSPFENNVVFPALLALFALFALFVALDLDVLGALHS